MEQFRDYVVRRNSIYAVLLFSTIFISTGKAQNKEFGLGVMLGEPTGFSAKYWLSEDKALDFGLAYSFVKSVSALSVHCDYVHHDFDLIKSKYQVPVYYGFGARLRVGSDENQLGARGVVGIVYIDKEHPFDVFLELAPVFNLFPKTSLQIDLALGARYYFR